MIKAEFDLPLALIKEDLKCRKFFGGLRELGLDDAYYQPDLASLILTLSGFDTECDQHYDLYYRLAEQRVPRVSNDPAALSVLALEVYEALVQAKNP